MSTLMSLAVVLGLDAAFFQNGLKDVEAQSEISAASIGANLSQMGGAIVTGGLILAGAVIGGVVEVIKNGVTDTEKWGQALYETNEKLGTTNEQSAGLILIADRLGVSQDTVTNSVLRFSKGLETVKGGAGTSEKALLSMGLTAYDTHGKLKDTTDILQMVADKMDAMPNGIAKDRLEMELFGRSGTDINEVLEGLANNGLQNAEDKADLLGLTLGGKSVDAARELSHNWNELGDTANAAFVRIGNAIMPTLDQITTKFLAWVESPNVQQGIQNIADWIGNLTSDIEADIPKAITFLQQIPDWMEGHKAIIVGVLAALGVAMIAFGISMWTILSPVLFTLGIMALVGVVAGLLYTAWTNDFGGIREKTAAVWAVIEPIFTQVVTWLKTNIPLATTALVNFWNGTLMPVFQTVWSWLQTNIPAAITTLTNFWNNTLLPAFQAGWSWINTYLVPIFKSLANLFNVAMTLAITALAGIWQNVLQPALQTFWIWLSTTLAPGFQAFHDFLNGPFYQVIQTVANFVSNQLTTAFHGLEGILKNVAGWIDQIAQKLASIQLPGWMKPGSPTPWEIGLRGVGSAMTELAQSKLPALAGSLSVTGVKGASGSNGFGRFQQRNNIYGPVYVGASGDAFGDLMAQYGRGR